MECVQTGKPRPIVLLSSLDQWETWGWKGKQPTQPLPRNTWLSWDSNTAQYNSKTLTPPYRMCCLVPLCRLIASPTYHFTVRQSSKWDSESLCFRWCWLLPRYLHYLHSDPHQRASPKCLGFYPWAFQKDGLLTLLLGVRWCLTKTLSLFCFYYSTSKREFPGTSPNAMTLLPSL